MERHDEFTRHIVQALNQQAKQHPARMLVVDHVMVAVKPVKRHRIRTWTMSGMALAAAISGISIVPNFFPNTHQEKLNEVVAAPKLSPQMIEDLEMLSLLGSENQKYGS